MIIIIIISESYSKHSYLIDDRYICAFAVNITLRGKMFVVKQASWNIGG